jgi:hypothetical protein
MVEIADFYHNPETGGFYYRPTGERWMLASIKSWFTADEIEKIKRQTAPPPPRLIEFSRGRRHPFG